MGSSQVLIKSHSAYLLTEGITWQNSRKENNNLSPSHENFKMSLPLITTVLSTNFIWQQDKSPNPEPVSLLKIKDYGKFPQINLVQRHKTQILLINFDFFFSRQIVSLL